MLMERWWQFLILLLLLSTRYYYSVLLLPVTTTPATLTLLLLLWSQTEWGNWRKNSFYVFFICVEYNANFLVVVLLTSFHILNYLLGFSLNVSLGWRKHHCGVDDIAILCVVPTYMTWRTCYYIYSDWYVVHTWFAIMFLHILSS